MTIGKRIAASLCCTGYKLLGTDLTLFDFVPAEDVSSPEDEIACRIDEALHIEWPEEHRTRFSVFVLPSGEGELRGYSGRADDDGGFDATLSDLAELAAEVLPRGTPPGYYLLEVEPGKAGSDDRAVIVARETEGERAERLARDGVAP